MMNKNEWKKVKLKELIYKPISGEWGKDYNTDNENTAYIIRTTNFTNNGSIDIFNKEVVKREISLSKIKEKKLIKNDIIIEKSGGSPTQPVGRVVFFDIESNQNFLCNNFTSILRTNGKVFPKYLFYNLRHLYQNKSVLKYQNKTTGIINLKLQNYIDDTNILLPPLEKQEKICKILDCLFNILEMKKRQLSELDSLVKFQFLKIFGDPILNEKNWEIKHLQELSILKSGGTPSRNNPNYFKGNIPWITTVSLGKQKISEEDAVEFITHEAIENSATKLIPVMSLLFGVRVGVGKSSINLVSLCTNQDIIAITEIKSIINIIFLKNLLDLHFDYFNTKKRGATIQGIKSDVLKNLSIICPPIELQNKFADFVKQVDKSKFEEIG